MGLQRRPLFVFIYSRTAAGQRGEVVAVYKTLQLAREHAERVCPNPSTKWRRDDINVMWRFDREVLERIERCAVRFKPKKEPFK